MIRILGVSKRASALLLTSLVLLAALLGTSCSSDDDPEEKADERESTGEPTVGTVPTTVAPTLPTLPGPTSTPTTPPDTRPPNAASRLSDNRRLWDQARPENYTMTYAVQCPCPPDISGPFTVQVEGDTVVNTQAPPEAMQGESPPTILSVDGLFSLIDSSIGEVTRVDVIYDPTYGYPTRIVLGDRFTDSDEDTTYQITAFTPA